MQIEKKNIAELLPADYNPRKDLKPGDPEYEKLKRSIEQFIFTFCNIKISLFNQHNLHLPIKKETVNIFVTTVSLISEVLGA